MSSDCNKNEGSPWYFSIVIILNAAVGAGMLAFSNAYHQAGGFGVALPIQIFFALLAIMNLIILAYLADKSGASDYQELVRGCCGRQVFLVCTLCIALYTFGSCIAYLIVIGDQWKMVFDMAIKDSSLRDSWWADRRFTIVVSTLVFIFPLCIPQKVNFLRYPSLVGVSGLVYIGFMVIIYYFTTEPNEPVVVKTSPDNWYDIFLAFPTIVFGFQVYDGLRGRPNIRIFSKAAVSAILIASIIYTLVGVFGYLSFGAKIQPNILLSFPPEPWAIVGAALLAVKIVTVYPIIHMVGRSAVKTIITSLFKVTTDQWESWKWRWTFGELFCWIPLSLVGALFIPNIGLAIDLLGGLAALFIFGFPGLALWCVTWCESRRSRAQDGIQQRPPSQWHLQGRLLLSAALMALSLFVFIVSTYQSIKMMIDSSQSSDAKVPLVAATNSD